MISSYCFKNRRDGVVVRASVSQSIDMGFLSHTKKLKSGIHSFPAWRSAHWDSVENKPENLLVVSLGKALNGSPPSSCGRKMARSSSLPNVMAQSDERHETEHELIRINKLFQATPSRNFKVYL